MCGEKVASFFAKNPEKRGLQQTMGLLSLDDM